MRFRADCRGGYPVQLTGLVAIAVVLGFITAGALFGFAAGFPDRSTVTAGSGECTYALTFDPQDVDGFAADRASSERYTDGTFPCLVWLDATSASDFAEGNSVTAWADKSTNGFDARSSGEAPKWATVDGIRAVRFNGSANNGLTVELDTARPTLDAESGLTVTMLVYVVDRTHRDGGLYAISDGEGRTAVDLRQSDVAADKPQANEWWATPGPNSTITTDGQWAIITHTVDADSGELFVDGDSQGQADSNVDELGSDVRIGASGSGKAFDGYVAEYFISNSRLSTGQRNLVECAMDAKHDSVVDLAAC